MTLTQQEIADGQHELNQPRDELLDNDDAHLGKGKDFDTKGDLHFDPVPDLKNAFKLTEAQRLEIAKGHLQGLTKTDVEDLQNNTDVLDANTHLDDKKPDTGFFTMNEIFIVLGMIGIGAIGFKLATKKKK